MVVDISDRKTDSHEEMSFSSAKVSRKKINTVEPLIFGDNISWRFDGFGLWDREQNRPHEELLEALRGSGVTSLRWPAGIEGDYCHWYEMIGDDRVAQIDPFSTKRRGELVVSYPYFGLEEFFSVCDELGIPAIIQLNCGNGTPEEAADLVRWCEDNRKNVCSYCVGNEMHLGEEMVPGVRVTKTPEEYIAFFGEFYDLISDYRDRIELGIVGLTSEHRISHFADWDEKVLSALADRIDFVDAHLGYTPYFVSPSTVDEQMLCYLASPEYVDRVIRIQLDNIRRYCPEHYGNITLQITEWGTLGGQYSNAVPSAVFTAALLGRMTEKLAISSTSHFSALLIYERSPTLVGYAQTDDGLKVFDNAISYVFRWYSAQRTRAVLETSVVCDRFDSDKRIGLIPEIPNAPTVYVNTYLDENTDEGSIILVNCNYKKAEKTEITLPFGIEVTDIAEVYSRDMLSCNSTREQYIEEYHHTIENRIAEDGRIALMTKPVSAVRVDFRILK